MKTLLPDYKPMLLDERSFGFDAPGWAYEPQFDGDRLLVEFGLGRCLLKTRSGTNATAWFPEITRPLSLLTAFPEGPYVVDGEVCVLDESGRSDFAKLRTRTTRKSWYGGCDPVVFCIFDLLVVRGNDITQRPYVERKTRLQQLFNPVPPGVLVVGQVDQGDQRLHDDAVGPLGAEGLVAKRIDSPYESGVRSSNWVKIIRPGVASPERSDRAD